MIYTDTVEIRGKQFIRTYSDTYRVMRDGLEYDEAIDPIDSGRTYTESETPLDTDEATAEDYQSALNERGGAGMTKAKLTKAVEAAKTETRDALQTIYDSLNQGQRKQIVKVAEVKALFDRYGVSYDA